MRLRCSVGPTTLAHRCAGLTHGESTVINLTLACRCLYRQHSQAYVSTVQLAIALVAWAAVAKGSILTGKLEL